MPIYKNRTPLAPTTEVTHYTNIAAIVSILDTRRLRLRRIDQWRDPFEGSVPKKQIEDQVAIFSSAYFFDMAATPMPGHYPDQPTARIHRNDPWEVMTKRRRAMTRSAHAICWRWGEESEAMWRLS